MQTSIAIISCRFGGSYQTVEIWNIFYTQAIIKSHGLRIYLERIRIFFVPSAIAAEGIAAKTYENL